MGAEYHLRSAPSFQARHDVSALDVRPWARTKALCVSFCFVRSFGYKYGATLWSSMSIWISFPSLLAPATTIFGKIRSMQPPRCWHHCYNHGLCNPETGTCSCAAGYSGDTCEIGACRQNCSGHGVCVLPTVPLVNTAAAPRSLVHAVDPSPLLSVIPTAGGCECHSGYTGADCSLQLCAGDCFGHGACLNGTCVCEPGFAGATCMEGQCARACLNGGECVPGGRCRCAPAFVGAGCGIPRSSRLARLMLLPPSPPPSLPPFDHKLCAGFGNCSGHGACVKGECQCDAGWDGVGCGEVACGRVECGVHGRCVRGACRCRPPWRGAHCELGACPSDCSGHGYCNWTSATCVCQPGCVA